MATLTGTKIKDTYDGLLKTDDSAALGVTPKKITDGLGNETGLSLSTNGNVFMDSDLNVGGNISVAGAFLDSNGGPGVAGQVLSSTLTGTDWVTLSELQGVDGTGTANKITKWLDSDTITDSSITDNGSSVSVANLLTVTGSITGSSIVKSGGTSSQFLKADGSVDSTLYATEADLTIAEGNIATNTSNIATNTSNIATNTSNIATNTSNIASNTTNIATNTSNIATNTSNIATNTSAIATKVSKTGDTMTGNLTAPSFIKTGGTSSEFLKADGSVDSNTYATTSDIDLSNTPSSTNVLVEISGGTDTTIASATTSLAGVMTAVDKTKLDGIEAGADVTDATNVAAAGAMMTGVALLNDLYDVAAAPSDGQVLTYSTSSSSWYASTVSGGGGGGADYTVSVINSNTTAQKDYLYVATASLTLTLPASPASGDKVAVSNMSGTTTLTIARNGQNIQGLAEDMIFNVAGYGLQLIYSGATKGWVII